MKGSFMVAVILDGKTTGYAHESFKGINARKYGSRFVSEEKARKLASRKSVEAEGTGLLFEVRQEVA